MVLVHFHSILPKFLQLVWDKQNNSNFDPYMPSVVFVGHWQIVQTLIRRHIPGYPLFACIIFYLNLNKNEKYHLTSLKTERDCPNW